MTGTDWFGDVLEFQKRFGFPVRARPEWPTPPEVELRRALIQEEYKELLDAFRDQDLVETADAITDLIYVLIGTAITMGLDLRPVWDEVQRSNLAKTGGLKSPAGKLLKPEGWEPPDIPGALGQGLIAV